MSRSLLASLKEMKLAYCGHIEKERGLPGEGIIIQGTTPGSHTRGKPKMTWIDDIKIVDWVVIDRTSKECGRQTSMEKE